jgi:hypothetical protein
VGASGEGDALEIHAEGVDDQRRGYEKDGDDGECAQSAVGGAGDPGVDILVNEAGAVLQREDGAVQILPLLLQARDVRGERMAARIFLRLSRP